MSIDRRKFLKIAAVAAAMAGTSPSSLAAAPGARRCRIKVLRRHCFSDLQSAWLDEPESGPCPLMAEGAEFEAVSAGRCPEGFCDKAWRAISPEIERLIAGDCDCGGCRASGRHEAITCCGDGTRPVIFHISLLHG